MELEPGDFEFDDDYLIPADSRVSGIILDILKKYNKIGDVEEASEVDELKISRMIQRAHTQVR